uniref:RING-type E3 ubiquitin transferase n=1 Tax=Arcella intermedia TaxID=1963864 RepID=A0A6B2KXF9_9EUKA
MGALAQELSAQEKVANLSLKSVERVIMTVSTMTDLPNQYLSAFDYLVKSYRIANEEKQKNMRNNSRVEVIDQIMNLIISYIGIILQFPEMFPNLERSPDNVVQQFVNILVKDADQPLPLDFLSRLVERFKDGGLKEIFSPIFSEISSKLLQPFKPNIGIPQIRALSLLLKQKPLVFMVIHDPKWIPNDKKNGKEIEIHSFLGPILRMSFMPTNTLDDMTRIIPDPITNEKEHIERIRTQSNLMAQHTAGIISNMIKSVKEAREPFVEWVAAALNRNKNRMKMNTDLNTVAAPGFMLNLSSLLLHLCTPFIDAKYSRTGSVDSDYLVKFNRLDVSEEETRLNMDLHQYRDYKNMIKPKDVMDTGENKTNEPNFITESFFSAILSLHYGVLPLLASYDRNIHSFDPARKVCIAAQLLDPTFLDICFQFYDFVSVWLVRTALGGTANRPSSLPISSFPKSFSAIPEFIVEDLVEFMIFYLIHVPRLESGNFDSIITFLVTFTSSSTAFKNPYLRGKLIELMSILCPRKAHKMKYDHFDKSPIGQLYLASGLVQFYIDIEITGASSQFYDKFNARYFVQIVMKHLWSLKSYKESFLKTFSDTALFLKFTNMLINDAIFLLDESFAKLGKIRKHQEFQESPQWASTPPARQRELDQEFQTNERMTKTYLLLGRSTCKMLHYLTKDLAKQFMVPELRDRTAAMLNYFLVQLAGPNYQSLKVKSPEKYNFKPRSLLKTIATSYLHFVAFDGFPAAVARDGRSYNPVIFESASNLLLKTKTIDEDVFRKLTVFLGRVKQEAEAQAKEEQDLSDAPEHFLDPLLQTLMTDPVKLPTSKVTIDRVTITRHLLSTPQDPFNRAPLTIEQLIPDDALKQEIDAWLATKKKH